MTTECLTDVCQIELDDAQEQALAAAAKALSHPARIRLLKILSQGQCLGSDLVSNLGLAQSTISEHLRILRKAGFIDAEVQHPRTCFSIKPEALTRYKALLEYLD
ncbi:ArsR/SmtB family transcription factor [Endozoicomonas arenosclerae]|uniref:ArsR/SmtB family transcription factor n=1 Tax=Endozoicomonas arenosclerae TaxID=1633495 RepID=UPI0007842A83|nr:winged helix-turn-helix domain-containing protein [Endozoicomonas arenosclerae]